MDSDENRIIFRSSLVFNRISRSHTFCKTKKKERMMKNETLRKKEIHEIGLEAYLYLYPLITMDVTRRISINLEPGVKPGIGPMNAFHHHRAFPPGDFREVVRPNFDTLYSSAWLDLTREPVIVSTADTGGRYFMLPMLDMWTDVFAVPGNRTSGSSAKSFAVIPKGWNGSLPEGVERVDAPTPYVWIIGRTQTNGPKDYEAVHGIQDGFRVTPLSRWGKDPLSERAVIDPKVDMETPPLVQVNTMPAARYFQYGAELMKLHPPHLTDWSMIARLKRIGIEPGKSFDFGTSPPVVREALEQAAREGLKLMKDKGPTIARVVNGWAMVTETMGVYGNSYLKRAIIAKAGLGANQPEDAIYPSVVGDADGKPLDGANRYVLHFERRELPPAYAFWSVTLYDADGFTTPNKLDRYALGDRDDLTYNTDGSLDLYIQHESPGRDKESNWLPSPAQGVLNVTMRLYAPKLQALDGRWVPLAIQRR